jgi:hypothetical protein
MEELKFFSPNFVRPHRVRNVKPLGVILKKTVVLSALVGTR